MHRVTNAAGIKVFYAPKNDSALVGTNRSVKDRSRKSGSIQECSLTKLASSGSTLQWSVVKGVLCLHITCWHLATDQQKMTS